MKFKDYYGIERTVTIAEIKQAYRKLAHKYHPDVSKAPLAEAKFKDIAEAYQTLKNPEKRTAYDKLGSHQSGEDFEPPREWREQFNDTESPFADVDLADILAAFTAARQAGEHARRRPPRQGQDYEVKASITLEQIYSGAEIDVSVNLPECDQQGLLHRVPRTHRVRVPNGAEDGQRLRLSGKGGQGSNGGRHGDFYVVRDHSLPRTFSYRERKAISVRHTACQAFFGCSRILFLELLCASAVGKLIKPGPC